MSACAFLRASGTCCGQRAAWVLSQAHAKTAILARTCAAHTRPHPARACSGRLWLSEFSGKSRRTTRHQPGSWRNRARWRPKQRIKQAGQDTQGSWGGGTYFALMQDDWAHESGPRSSEPSVGKEAVQLVLGRHCRMPLSARGRSIPRDDNSWGIVGAKGSIRVWNNLLQKHQRVHMLDAE